MDTIGGGGGYLLQIKEISIWSKNGTVDLKCHQGTHYVSTSFKLAFLFMNFFYLDVLNEDEVVKNKA